MRMQLPSCAECTRPIRNCNRYRDVVHRCMQALDGVRRRQDVSVVAAEILTLSEDKSKLRQAKEAAEEMQVAFSRSPVPLIVLGEVFRRQGRFDEAIDNLERARAKIADVDLAEKARWTRLMLVALSSAIRSAKRRAQSAPPYDEDEERLPAEDGISDAQVDAELLELTQEVVNKGRDKGYWFLCPNGHRYLIGECGGAMERSRCPDCGESVGGGSHQLTAGNRRADDGLGATLWDTMAAQNPRPDAAMIRRIQRGE